MYFWLPPLPVYLRMPLYLWRPPSLLPSPTTSVNKDVSFVAHSVSSTPPHFLYQYIVCLQGPHQRLPGGKVACTLHPRNLGQYLCLVLFVFIEYFWLKMCVTSGIRVFAKWTSRPREHSVTCPSGDQHQHHQHQQRQHQNQHQDQQISIIFSTIIGITAIVKCQKFA